jgi:hypothetical protein
LLIERGLQLDLGLVILRNRLPDCGSFVPQWPRWMAPQAVVAHDVAALEQTISQSSERFAAAPYERE